MRSPLPFPCVPDRPYKILLVQVGTLSFSHPSFGVPVLFIYSTLARQERNSSTLSSPSWLFYDEKGATARWHEG